MKLNTEQTAALAYVTTTHAKRIQGEATVRAEIEAQFESRMHALRNEESVAVNRALGLGVPKRQIAMFGLGTTAIATVGNVASYAAATYVPESPELTIDLTSNTVTFHWLDLPGLPREYGEATFILYDDQFSGVMSVGILLTEDALSKSLDALPDAWWAEANKRITAAYKEATK